MAEKRFYVPCDACHGLGHNPPKQTERKDVKERGDIIYDVSDFFISLCPKCSGSCKMLMPIKDE